MKKYIFLVVLGLGVGFGCYHLGYHRGYSQAQQVEFTNAEADFQVDGWPRNNWRVAWATRCDEQTFTSQISTLV